MVVHKTTNLEMIIYEQNVHGILIHTVFMGKYSFFLLSFFSRFIEALSLTVGIEQKITIAYYSFIQYLAMLYLGLLGKKKLGCKG